MFTCDITKVRSFARTWLTVNYHLFAYSDVSYRFGERGGLVVNASDSGSRGPGFEPHSGQTVLCP